MITALHTITPVMIKNKMLIPIDLTFRGMLGNIRITRDQRYKAPIAADMDSKSCPISLLSQPLLPLA
jgi:hypothetical protein